MARAYCSGGGGRAWLGIVGVIALTGLGTKSATPAWPAVQVLTAQAPSSETRGFIVFVGGRAVGREDVTTSRTPDGFTITGHGRVGDPVDVTATKVEMRYAADWAPASLLIEGTVRGRTVSLRTSFTGLEAASESVEDGTSLQRTDKVSPRTVVVPNLFFGMYEALAQRLVGAVVGAELPAYVAPQAEMLVRVRAVRADRVQTGNTVLSLRLYELAVASPGGDLLMQLAADDAGHLVRLTVPAQRLDVVREDVAAASSRSLTHANPGDEAVTIPAYGFNIAGTITRPQATTPARMPAVVLLGGSETSDRDGVVAGVPIISQLAGALASAGFLTLRYDRRGYGQSGGRAEAATLADFADDVRTVVKYLDGRKDVDGKRIAVVGHGDGAWVALLAAAKDGRIDAVVSIGGASSTGADLMLEQQAHALDLMKAPPADRQAKVELQRKIQAAVMGGQSWDGIPTDVRRTADTPWFQSLLRFDPAAVMKGVSQPLLVVQADLDRQVPRAHADKLVELAKRRGDKKPVELAALSGVNHLLIPASTGEVAEYASLRDGNVSKDAAPAIAGWLSRTWGHK